MMMYGIDVSQHNGVIDWKKVKESGKVQFAIIRSSFGWTDGKPETRIDSRLEENVRGCEENGIPYGFYHYSYCTVPENAKREARFFMDVIKNYHPTFPVALDIEDPSQIEKLNTEQRMAIVMDFCKELSNAGYLVAVWSFKAFFEAYLDAKAINDQYYVWVSQYANRFTYNSSTAGLWQYSNQGSIPGITGNVDLNVSYVDYVSSILKNGFNDPKAVSDYIQSGYGEYPPFKIDMSYLNAPKGYGIDGDVDETVVENDLETETPDADDPDPFIEVNEKIREVAEKTDELTDAYGKLSEASAANSEDIVKIKDKINELIDYISQNK